MARFGPASGIDLTQRPADLPADIGWTEGDVFERGAELSGGILVANLFLHHFLEDDLARLGGLAQSFEVLVINEPYRHEHTLWKSDKLMPLVGETTRHDMPVSIRAGFVGGELAGLLGLDPGKWRISERSTWRGSLQLLALRS